MKTWLSTKEAALFLEVAESSLNKSRCGYPLLGVKGPDFMKIGRNVRYKNDTLQAWKSQFNEQLAEVSK